MAEFAGVEVEFFGVEVEFARLEAQFPRLEFYGVKLAGLQLNFLHQLLVQVFLGLWLP